MLAESFPKDLLVAFSGLAQKTFPPLSQLCVQNITKSTANNIIVEGGSLGSHKEVLRWMLGCCDGSGFRQYPIVAKNTFWHYMNVYESAQKLQIEVLTKELWRRINLIAAKQVHSEDIHQIYQFKTPKDHVFRIMAVESIGKALMEKTLMARGAYDHIRTEFPDFNTDLGNYIDEVKYQRYQARKVEIEAEKAERAASQKQQWADNIRTAYASQVSRKTGKKHIPEAKNTENTETGNGVEENDEQHASVRSRLNDDGSLIIVDSAVIVRKAARGRPNYVRANLGLLGLKDDNFRPERPRSSRQPRRVIASR